MLAKELMIGDWVTILRFRENDSDRNVRVNAIGQDCILAPGMFQDETGCDPYDEKKIAPVSLTAEILEKNGWTKRKGYPTEYEFIEGECVHIYYDTKHCHLMIDLYDDNIINIVENRTHRLQQALRLCGLNDLADNFRV